MRKAVLLAQLVPLLLLLPLLLLSLLPGDWS
jgi:hypothetical protein